MFCGSGNADKKTMGLKPIESRRARGVTLIELVVTIAVLAILVMLATPSFRDLAERKALQGVAEGVVGLIGTAKEEATKRDTGVRVQFSALGGGVCAGANLVSEDPCDCAVASSCSIGRFPDSANDLRMVTTKTAPSFGTGTSFVIDPKTATLEDPAAAGLLELETPKGYAVQLSVNAVARPRYCSSGTRPMTGVESCTE